MKIFVCDEKGDYAQDYSVRSFGKIWRWRGDDSETLQPMCGPEIARSRLVLIRVNMKEWTLFASAGVALEVSMVSFVRADNDRRFVDNNWWI